MYCGHCGEKQYKDAAFCKNCGKTILIKIPKSNMKFSLKF